MPDALLSRLVPDFEIYGVTTWFINNCNKYIAQYLKK